jgi:hypothetical protein
VALLNSSSIGMISPGLNWRRPSVSRSVSVMSASGCDRVTALGAGAVAVNCAKTAHSRDIGGVTKRLFLALDTLSRETV